METLQQLVNLSAKTETITMMELRANPGEILEQVMLGKKFVVTKAGKEIALLRPIEKTTINKDGSWIGEMPITMKKYL